MVQDAPAITAQTADASCDTSASVEVGLPGVPRSPPVNLSEDCALPLVVPLPLLPCPVSEISREVAKASTATLACAPRRPATGIWLS